jgi:hypothetical protein
MDATGDMGKAAAPERATAPEAPGATPAPHPASDQPFGRGRDPCHRTSGGIAALAVLEAVTGLASRCWSLLASRALVWDEAQSR